MFEMTGPPMTPAPSSESLCLDASDAKNARRLLAAVVVPGSRCSVEDVRVAGRSVSWTAACTGRYRGAGEGELSFAAERADGRFVLRVEDVRGATHEVRYRLEGKRSGACEP